MTLTPVGCPVALRVSALLKPPLRPVVIVELVDVPLVTPMAAGLAEIEKSIGMLDVRTFNSAMVAQGLPLTSLISRRRAYRPAIGLNVTVCWFLSPGVATSTPLETNVHVLPSLLT